MNKQNNGIHLFVVYGIRYIHYNFLSIIPQIVNTLQQKLIQIEDIFIIYFHKPSVSKSCLVPCVAITKISSYVSGTQLRRKVYVFSEHFIYRNGVNNEEIIQCNVTNVTTEVHFNRMIDRSIHCVVVQSQLDDALINYVTCLEDVDKLEVNVRG